MYPTLSLASEIRDVINVVENLQKAAEKLCVPLTQLMHFWAVVENLVYEAEMECLGIIKTESGCRAEFFTRIEEGQSGYNYSIEIFNPFKADLRPVELEGKVMIAGNSSNAPESSRRNGIRARIKATVTCFDSSGTQTLFSGFDIPVAWQRMEGRILQTEAKASKSAPLPIAESEQIEDREEAEVL